MLNSSNVVPLNEVFAFDYIEMFVNDKEKHSGSEKTAISYRSDIKQFFTWKVGNIEKYKDLKKLTDFDLKLGITEIRDYRSYLIDELNNNNKTINRKINVVKDLYERFLKRGLVDETDLESFDDMVNLKTVKNKYGVVKPHELFAIADYLKNKKSKGRQRNLNKSNIVLFSAQTGLRLSSILELKLNDFVENDVDVRVYADRIKGGKSTEKIIDKKFYKELLHMHKVEGENKDKMFNLSVKAVNNMMEDVRNHFNFSEHRNIVFHSFRKCGGNHVFKLSGNDLTVARDFLDHTDTKVTEDYLDNNVNVDLGIVTTMNTTNHELYKEVTHEQLLSVIEKLDGTTKLMINTLLSKMN